MKPATAITFEDFDHFFAQFLISKNGTSKESVYMAAALSSNVLREGHIWCDLSEFAGKEYIPYTNPDSTKQFPKLDDWIQDLSTADVVGCSGDYKPLILESTSICLYRYWKYEQQTADLIYKKSITHQNNFDIQEIEKCIDSITDATALDEFQRNAIIAAANNNFTIITGGPGTGKTSTVAKIAAVLITLHGKQPFRIALAAPTGKAAMRLGESLQNAISQLNVEEILKKSVPTETQTIHRLLGTIPGSVNFNYNKIQPLPFDLVIIDEASMVDIALMSKLLDAIPQKCRLILLGDKDQLASVEAGSVLADICTIFDADKINASKHISHSNEDFSPSVITLKKSFRFSNNSGIGQLADAINSCSVDLAWSIVNVSDECKFESALDLQTLQKKIRSESRQWTEKLGTIKDPESALQLLNEFRILTALRQGQWGAHHINNLLTNVSRSLLKTNPSIPFFDGMPIIITSNDYRNNLFNGDTGIIFRQSNLYFAFFKSAGNSVRSINLNTLLSWEPAFAITVHKSQGSEFLHTVFVLPPNDTPLLSRELLYTAVTRSRKSITIIGDEYVFRTGIKRGTKRCSGLVKRFAELNISQLTVQEIS
jgi:exodeoxyribonuclease V alpha subunit